jgi:hypothetical protein
MKTLCLTIWLFAISSISPLLAQSFEKLFFPKEYILLYNKSFLKIDSNYNQIPKNRFFHTFEGASNPLTSKVAFNENEDRITEINKLKGMVFKVIELQTIDGKSLTTDFLKSNQNDQILFHLKDTLSNESIYFIFKSEDKWTDFPFICSKLNKTIYKEFLSKEIDDFDGETRIGHPYFDVVNLYKTITKGIPRYYLSLNAGGITPNVGIKGVDILFMDGSKLNKPAIEVDVDINTDGSGYTYSAFLTLTTEEMKKLSKQPIRKFRLYVYDGMLSLEEGVLIMGFAGALLQAK